MEVLSLRVYNVRSYNTFLLELDSRVTLILGQNGVGKTSLLESLYFLYRGTSFRGRDRDMVGYEKPYAELKITFPNNKSRHARLTPASTALTKQFTVNDKKSARLSALQRLPVVLFEPDELRLLTSSPARRRDFIDGIISRLSPTYQTVINRFARTLLQRNELLKQFELLPRDTWESHLFAWDVKLAELSAGIIKARRNFILQSNEKLSSLYSSLAAEKHEVKASYHMSVSSVEDAALQQTILAELESRRTSDAHRGYTSIGPHRDDVSLSLDDHPAAESASRGEMRTIMLAFKLLEVELQEHHSGQKPLILLDDVFSELDVNREHALLASLSDYQTVITATDLRNELKATAKIIEL